MSKWYLTFGLYRRVRGVFRDSLLYDSFLDATVDMFTKKSRVVTLASPIQVLRLSGHSPIFKTFLHVLVYVTVRYAITLFFSVCTFFFPVVTFCQIVCC